jgi:WD40-like Beta Propeller Repeat
LDLYSCQKISIGKWAVPQNLGEAINTKEDEDFPNISMDGKTLYFSSKGHISMGGYDIFKAEYDETKKAFSNAKNIGYPVNTTYDNMNFRVSKNGKYGYIAAIRPNGLGENDIYRVNFNEVEPDYTVIVGGFNSIPNTGNFNDFFISVNDSQTNELVGNYIPNPLSGRYIMILTPGKYQMIIESPGYKTIEKTIEVLDKASYQAEINMNIDLVK